MVRRGASFYLQFRRLLATKRAMKPAQLVLSAEIANPIAAGMIEEQGYARGFRCVAGLDEVGRGPLAGPVVAAAVVLPRGFSHENIRDSKVLTAGQRTAAASVIRERAVSWALGFIEVEEIDRVNILNASLLAMARAVAGLDPPADYLLIDGSQEIPVKFLAVPAATAPARPVQRAIKKGDKHSISIAAASILAKVARDDVMMEWHRIYPEYGFDQHKGYASPIHLDALRRLGPTPIHRRSFKPVRELCNEETLADAESLFPKG